MVEVEGRDGESVGLSEAKASVAKEVQCGVDRARVPLRSTDISFTSPVTSRRIKRSLHYYVRTRLAGLDPTRAAWDDDGYTDIPRFS